MNEEIAPPARESRPVRPQTGKKRVGELEDELRETLKRYEIIFRATNDVLYDLNFDSSVVVWNEALYTQFGYNEDEPTGTLEWWAGHIHPDDAMGVEHAVTELLETSNNNWNYEYRFRKADGSYAYVRDRGYIIRSSSGAPQRIIGSFLDISRQKQLDRAKDEFSSLISHQLRTPLTVIQIYSALLADGTFGVLSDAQAHEVRKINASSVKLIELVNDILAISSVELQRVRLAAVPTDINALISGCVAGASPLAVAKPVTLSFEPANTVGTICTDPKIIEQALHNLLTNAIRYSPAGTGVVSVAVAPYKDGCRISVADNGIGIPSADKSHVFERFYRANNAVNTEEHGTGLGLYYVRLVAESFGGRVWFKSAKGKGTTFYIYVPSVVA